MKLLTFSKLQAAFQKYGNSTSGYQALSKIKLFVKIKTTDNQHVS